MNLGSRLLRVLRHFVFDERAAQRLLDPAAQQRLASQVARSEALHSGEVRICIEGRLPLSHVWRGAPVRERALDLFAQLRVWDTADNNGVLIYLLLAERRIEIIADRNVHQRAGATVWNEMVQQLGAALAAGRFEDGLHHALDAVTTQLTTHFALAPGQVNANELPDAPVLR